MRTPAEMQIITIDITNACDQRCSNCTRFCGNHKRPFFMDHETFCRAIDSMEGYEGLTSIIGGEPTLHPEFERFMLHVQKRFGKSESRRRLIGTKDNYIRELLRREEESYTFHERDENSLPFRRFGPCIFTNAGQTYRKYYELIQDTFNVQFLNDHVNPSFHTPGLVSRRDLGIPDDQWLEIRNNCWLQNNWSATITPKGAFFCEVAGALDMLFDGPGGWEIEPGWWRRAPDQFGDQLQWCELCGFALDRYTFARRSDEEIDDVSPTLYKMLEEAGSPRMKSGRVKLLDIKNGTVTEESKADGRLFTAAQRYIEHYEDRFDSGHLSFMTTDYDIATIPAGNGFGAALNSALADANEWLLLCEENVPTDGAVDDLIETYVLNPGAMYLGDSFAFFSKRAISLREYGFDRIAHLKNQAELVSAWQQDKIVRLGEIGEILRWQHDAILPGKRYAIWGMGVAGSYLADVVQSSGGLLSVTVDKDAAKWGAEFYGTTARPPEYLMEHTEDYDFLLIGHYTRYTEIKREAIAMGIPACKIRMPYEV